jgi:3-hydroxyisobutyrate dehydrogenase-like beta-hydroxyacid dehydrogenase
MNVGFIGLGIMGASMASNLQAAGHALFVHDVRKPAAASHLAAGAVWKDTPRAVAEAAEVVFTSLPGPPEVEQVATGPDGLLHGIRAGSALSPPTPPRWCGASTASSRPAAPTCSTRR